MKDNQLDKCFKGKRVSAILKKICAVLSRYTFFLLGEHAGKGYHGASLDINDAINSGDIPGFNSETQYKSPGKLFLIKLLHLLEQQKKSFSKRKHVIISMNEWRWLLKHYIGVGRKSILKKYIKFWTNAATGVLQEKYVQKNGKQTRVADGYSLTPANSHIETLFIGLGYDDKDVKNKASLKSLFNRDKKAPEILKEILEHTPWADAA